MLDHMRDNCDHISRASSLPSEESRDPNRQIISPKEATGISALRDIAKGLKTVLHSSGFKKLMKLNAMCPKVVRPEQLLSATNVAEASSVLQACEELQLHLYCQGSQQSLISLPTR
jgi:hypothetical protein